MLHFSSQPSDKWVSFVSNFLANLDFHSRTSPRASTFDMLFAEKILPIFSEANSLVKTGGSSLRNCSKNTSSPNMSYLLFLASRKPWISISPCMFLKAIFAEGFSKIAPRAKWYISFHREIFFISVNDNSIVIVRISPFIQTIMNRTFFICF